MAKANAEERNAGLLGVTSQLVRNTDVARDIRAARQGP